jgi:hypothetical protein
VNLYILIYQGRHIDHLAFYICSSYGFNSEYSLSVSRYAPSQEHKLYKSQKDLPLVIMKEIVQIPRKLCDIALSEHRDER